MSRNWDGETHALGFRLATPEVKLSTIKARHLRALLPGRMELGNVFRRDSCNAQERRREKAVADFSSLLLPWRSERVVYRVVGISLGGANYSTLIEDESPGHG